jgi:hypothetical protein
MAISHGCGSGSDDVRRPPAAPHAIQEACSDNAAYYHFGESGPSRGLCAFKERFGAAGYGYPEVRFEHVPSTRTNLTARSAIKRLVGYRPG